MTVSFNAEKVTSDTFTFRHLADACIQSIIHVRYKASTNPSEGEHIQSKVP